MLTELLDKEHEGVKTYRTMQKNTKRERQEPLHMTTPRAKNARVTAAAPDPVTRQALAAWIDVMTSSCLSLPSVSSPAAAM